MIAEVHTWPTREGATLVLGECSAYNAVGLNAHQTWAFWRAEVAPLSASPFRLANGDRATMAVARTVPAKDFGAARLASLSIRCLESMEAALRNVANAGQRLGLFLVLNERYDATGDAYFAAHRHVLEVAIQEWLAARVPDVPVQVYAFSTS